MWDPRVYSQSLNLPDINFQAAGNLNRQAARKTEFAKKTFQCSRGLVDTLSLTFLLCGLGVSLRLGG
jgi:hypothetical protein